MKFFCEYCGCRIDAEKDTKCPNCGASYKKNKKFIELEEERKKAKQKTSEYANAIMDNTMSAMKFSKVIFIIPIIIFIIVFITMITHFVGVAKRNNQNSNNNNNTTIKDNTNTSTNTEEKDKPVTVGMNEYGSTKTYRVKVTNYEVVTYWYKEAKEGYEYVKFELMLENLTDSRLTRANTNCIVDGVAMTNEMSSGYSSIPLLIDSSLTVTGEATFEVPKNATGYDIRYGDYVTIHIEK